MKQLYHDIRRRTAMLLCMLFFLACFVNQVLPAFAYTSWTSSVTEDNVNVRTGPGTSYGYARTSSGSRIQLDGGHTVLVIGQAQAGDGATWYQIRFTYTDGSTYEGYMHGNYVQVKVEDPEFEAYLDAQGFPESYKDGLRHLHTLYPEWVFTAFHTGLTWEETITAQTALGKSLVLDSKPTAWKSLQDGAYDWETGTWITFDSGGWVQASKEIISYYMDPRNFLGASSIFQFMLQSYDAEQQTMEGLERILSGSFLAADFTDADGTVQSYKDIIMEAAEKSGVNPYVLAATMQQEQGSGTNNNISGTCPGWEGYYNYFNIGAYRTDTMTAAERGLWFASGQGQGLTTYMRPWTTRRAAIIGGSIWYGEKYVSVGQNTLYLKKYNVQGDKPFTHQYMTNVGAANSEGVKLAKAYDEQARAAALQFVIPVYKNMPETTCKQPTGDGSPNYLLSSLSVEGFSLTPVFDKYQSEYNLIVPYETSAITVTAQALDSESTVKGAGYVNLQVGINDVQIVVTAGNGTTKTYSLIVARQEAPEPPDEPESETDPPEMKPAEPVVQTTLHLENGIASGVPKVPLPAAELLGAVTVTDGSAQLLDASGNGKTGHAATGDVLQILREDGSVFARYAVVIYGDANGDGEISVVDMVRIQRTLLKQVILNDTAVYAADANRDGEISVVDMVRIQRYILKQTTISQ